MLSFFSQQFQASNFCDIDPSALHVNVVVNFAQSQSCIMYFSSCELPFLKKLARAYSLRRKVIGMIAYESYRSVRPREPNSLNCISIAHYKVEPEKKRTTHLLHLSIILLRKKRIILVLNYLFCGTSLLCWPSCQEYEAKVQDKHLYLLSH